MLSACSFSLLSIHIDGICQELFWQGLNGVNICKIMKTGLGVNYTSMVSPSLNNRRFLIPSFLSSVLTVIKN